MTPIDANDLQKACDLLTAGDVVAIPTETVYGLAASIESSAGLRKIFALKERPFFDPLIVHVNSFAQARTLVKEWPPLADFLTRTFWPGPLTVVLPKSEKVDPLITSGLPTVAIRQPAHPIAADLIRLLGHPIAAPSANKFGRTSPSRAEHVRAEFVPDTPFILDGGPCEVGVESTVITFGESTSLEDEVLILRAGGVTREMIDDALKRWSRPTSVRFAASEASPGSLKHHYMPKIPLVILREDESASFSEAVRERLKDAKLTRKAPAELTLNTDPTVAARELYSEMRRIAENGSTDLIYVRKQTSHADGLWRAIWDRLMRAATLDLS